MNGSFDIHRDQLLKELSEQGTRPQPSGLYFFPVLILLKTQLIFLLIEQFCVDSVEDL